MRSSLQDLVASITLCTIGGSMIIICLSLNSFQSWYRHVNSLEHTVTQVFFYIGIFFFILGLLTFLRMFFRSRPNFRGLVVQRNQPNVMPQQTTVVMSTVLPTYSYQQNPQPYPQQDYISHQQTTPVKEFHYPQAPPAYSVN